MYFFKKNKTPWIPGPLICRRVIHTSPVCGKDSWGPGLPQFLLPPPRPLPPAVRSILKTKERKEAETPGAPRGDGSCSLSPCETPMSAAEPKLFQAQDSLGAPGCPGALSTAPSKHASRCVCPPSPSSSAHPIHSPSPGPQLPRH